MERLLQTSGRRTCENIIEVSTTGFDPDRQGVGTTWMPGDPHDSRLFIPPAPTVAANRRYLFALCGHNVPAGQTHHLIGFRQKLLIGEEFVVQGGSFGDQIFVKEFPVTTPDWSFSDGNVTWCFRFLPGKRQVARQNVVGAVNNSGPSRTNNPYGAYSALVYQDGTTFIAPSGAGYFPPFSGQPPGYAVQGVSTIFDVRNPWTAPNPIIDTELRGPGDLIMYASVRQSDIGPLGRPVWVPPPGFDVGALVPEDRFLLAFPNALYRHIAGAMMIDVNK